MSLILGKAFNQHSPRGAEALLLCQEELISVLIRRSLLSLNITLGTSPAILSQITQLSSFSAFHPRSPPSSSPTSLNSFPPPFFRLIFQSTINSLLITEVMEVVLPLLAPLLSFLCQYFWLQRPDPFRCWGNMLRPWWVCFVFVLGATSLSSASSSFYCSQWCLCDIWTNFSLATSLSVSILHSPLKYLLSLLRHLQHPLLFLTRSFQQQTCTQMSFSNLIPWYLSFPFYIVVIIFTLLLTCR